MNGIIENYINVFKKCTQFTGRASRSEYWLFFLMNIVVSIIAGVIDGITGIPILGLLYMLAALLPGLAVTIRRLHDTDRSGWWLLIGLIPLVGLVLLVFMIMEGTKGPNKFGEDPVGGGSLATA